MKRVFTLSEKVHGPGPVLFSWQSLKGNYLSTVGSNNVLNIYDRHGELKDKVQLQGFCTGICWDLGGDYLAIINDKSSHADIWDANTFKVTELETSFKEVPTLVVWAKTSSLLAVCTLKGNLLIYNHLTSRKLPVIGKHTKKITCGCWSQQDLLALAGEDRMLTVSSHDGDTIRQVILRADPSDVQFSVMKQDERVIGENTISLVVGKKTLFLYNLNDSENPIELAFQQRYGNIESYQWFGDGYILIGFSNGFFVAISTHMKEIGQELFQARNHRDGISDIAISTSLSKAASCGDNSVRIHELTELKQTFSVVVVDEERQLDKLSWTEDGQLFAVSSQRGFVHVYLSKLPVLNSTYATKIVSLTSLLEVTFQDNVEKEKPVVLKLDLEPSLLCLGPFHFAFAMNNRVWFYQIAEKANVALLHDREYMGTVSSMCMNADYASVLYEGKLQLHLIENDGENNEEREAILFPDADKLNEKITCHVLTTEFLIFATDKGTIRHFLLEEWQIVGEYNHQVGIANIYPETTGIRLILANEMQEAFLYSPVDDANLEIPESLGKIKGILWDRHPLDKGIFAIYNEEKIQTYILSWETIYGAKVEYVGVSKLPSSQYPVLLYNGELTCQTNTGKLVTMRLIDSKSGGDAQANLQQCIKLKRFKEGWEICNLINNKQDWITLAKAALENLDLETALQIYRHIADVGMVWTLESKLNIEDRNLLAGHVAVCLANFDLAQALFLNSSMPLAALEMRRDLLQWDLALQLANKLAPDQIPFISREYSQQLEFLGEYSNSLAHYERAIVENGNLEDHNVSCQMGIARMSIRCGDIRRGLAIAEKLKNRTLNKECAEILESMKQYTEAAVLYERGEFYDKASLLYIRLKNWQKVGEILPNVTSPKIYLHFASAKESDGQYLEAAKAYKGAHDYESAIRIYIDHLKSPDEAVKLVNETKSIEGAKMVARFFQGLDDYSSAIQFLILSKCNDEAFQLAQKYGKMKIYSEIIGSDGTTDEYQNIACYYENEKNFTLAGKFYFLAKCYNKAMKYLLKKSLAEDDQAIQLAIEVVGEAKDEKLTKQLVDFLMGEVDGIPKDAKYIFRLYMACKQYREAAKTATIIAKEEQNSGNYRIAHDVLFSMFQELNVQKIKIPSEMYTNLMILHSYILVKVHVKLGDHLKGARMLIRVANHISRFPLHIVAILTSTVIECHRAGLKKSAFGYAVMLMRPEYRNQIDVKYKKKIESIVRKPHTAEEEEPCTPCPFCENELPETELFCTDCKNNIPFCIATGKHVLARDFTQCPHCLCPAIMTDFKRLLESESSCPMCSKKVLPQDLKIGTDAQKLLFANN